MRVVLDTNIIISSYFSSSSPLARIRDYGQQGTYTLVISEELLAEYGKVLNYESVAKRHGMSAAKVAEEVSRIRGFSILVPLGEIPNVIPEDPDDNIVIATAVAGETTYIVSGDADLHRLGQYRGIQILSPALFLALLSDS